MKKTIIFLLSIFLIASTKLNAQHLKEPNAKSFLRTVEVDVPGQENNVIKTSWPSIGCWFWTNDDLKPGGYKSYIDLYEKYSSIGLLTTILRCPGELTDPIIHDQIKEVSEYARKKGIGIVMDLDVRAAREKFKEKYPNKLQQILFSGSLNLKEMIR